MTSNQDNNSHSLKKFNNKVLNAVAIIIVSLILTLLLIFGFRIILLILSGILVASFFLGIAQFIESRTPLGRKFALIISVLVVNGILIGGIFILAPQITSQIDALRDELPKAANETYQKIENTELGGLLISQFKGIDISEKQKEILNFFGSLFSIISTIYIVLFLGLFFMINPTMYKDSFVKLFPLSKRKRTDEILETMGRTLQSWLLGKLFSMLIVGILTVIGLSILDVPLALTLGIFAALISFVPNFGPILALVPAFFLAYTESSSMALYVTLLYIGIQAIESNILTPLIQKKMISFPMAMVLIAQIILGLFTGILGVILAVPLVAIIMVAIKMAYIEDVLGDKEIDVKYDSTK